tara:strand:+ start:183 stop:341 length:159 start_codon:yes stop_codon:yes gene_type:complete
MEGIGIRSNNREKVNVKVDNRGCLLHQENDDENPGMYRQATDFAVGNRQIKT